MEELPRVSVVVVGPSGAGKTSLLASLRICSTGLCKLFSVDHFLTKRRDYTAIDFPKDASLKTFLAGAMPAKDMALLVVPAGFAANPTNETNDTKKEVVGLHLRVLASLGVQRLVVAVSKMDLVHFQEHEFVQTKQDIQRMLLAAGWPRDLVERRTAFVPISVCPHHNDNNISTPSTRMQWWEESVRIGESPTVTLIDALDNIQLPNRVDPAMRHALREASLFVDVVAELVLAYVGFQAPLQELEFRMPILGCLQVRGVGNVLAGYVAQGSLPDTRHQGQLVLTKDVANIGWAEVQLHHKALSRPLPGDLVGVGLHFGQRRPSVVRGDCLVKRGDPLSRCSSFTARVSVLGSIMHKMRVGFVPRCHVGFGSSGCKITAINWRLTERGNHMSLQPESVVVGDTAEIVFEPLRPLLCEVFTRCAALGRVLVFHGNVLLMAGTVEAVGFAQP